MNGIWAAPCALLLALTAGMSSANAAPLDDAAERYRPYAIEGIGSALAGACCACVAALAAASTATTAT